MPGAPATCPGSQPLSCSRGGEPLPATPSGPSWLPCSVVCPRRPRPRSQPRASQWGVPGQLLPRGAHGGGGWKRGISGPRGRGPGSAAGRGGAGGGPCRGLAPASLSVLAGRLRSLAGCPARARPQAQCFPRDVLPSCGFSPFRRRRRQVAGARAHVPAEARRRAWASGRGRRSGAARPAGTPRSWTAAAACGAGLPSTSRVGRLCHSKPASSDPTNLVVSKEPPQTVTGAECELGREPSRPVVRAAPTPGGRGREQRREATGPTAGPRPIQSRPPSPGLRPGPGARQAIAGAVSPAPRPVSLQQGHWRCQGGRRSQLSPCLAVA